MLRFAAGIISVVLTVFLTLDPLLASGSAQPLYRSNTSATFRTAALALVEVNVIDPISAFAKPNQRPITTEKLLVAQQAPAMSGAKIPLIVAGLLVGLLSSSCWPMTAASLPEPENDVQLFSQSVDAFVSDLYRLYVVSSGSRDDRKKHFDEIKIVRDRVLNEQNTIHDDFNKRMLISDAKHVAALLKQYGNDDGEKMLQQEFDEGQRALQTYNTALRNAQEILSQADVALGIINSGQVIHQDTRVRYGGWKISDVPPIYHLYFRRELAALENQLLNFEALNPQDETVREVAAHAVQTALDHLSAMPYKLVVAWIKEVNAGAWKDFQHYHNRALRTGA